MVLASKTDQREIRILERIGEKVQLAAGINAELGYKMTRLSVVLTVYDALLN